LRFESLQETSASKVALSDWFEPCAARADLLALRIGAGWCGTCRWQAQHTSTLDAFGPRLELVDVIFADEDNAPADGASLASFRKWVVSSRPRTLVADPGLQLSPLLPERLALPAIVLVDRRTMTVVEVIAETDVDVVSNRIARAFAKLDGSQLPDPLVPALTDGFAKWQIDMMKDMLLQDAPPPDPSNAKADDPLAATFGAALFSETRFSANQAIACATCHVAAKGYSDGLPTAKGIGATDRNAPSITLSSHARSEFWDGRADSLWSQAAGPVEAANEMGSTRLRVAHFLYDQKRSEYEAIFGSMPALSDASRFPPDGKPGDAAWEAMAGIDKDAIDRVFSNAAKAIAAHERTLRVQPNALDRYVAGDAAALTTGQKDGLRAFFDVGCAQCHHGPRLTDDAFHALRFPTGRVDGMPDRGRIDAIAVLQSNEFGRSGPFSDSKVAATYAAKPSMLGAFKTPTLRGLPLTAPYGHGGTYATLDEVIAVYADGGHPAEPNSTGTLEPWLLKFDTPQVGAILELMNVLSGDPQN
jgi:cytochrome c peroxidase